MHRWQSSWVILAPYGFVWLLTWVPSAYLAEPGGPSWVHGARCGSLSPGSSDEVSLEESEDVRGTRGSLEGNSQHRANTTMHVCWYRNTSVSRADHSAAVEVWMS